MFFAFTPARSRRMLSDKGAVDGGTGEEDDGDDGSTDAGQDRRSESAHIRQ